MKSRFSGRNPAFRPCHRPVTPMDVLDSDGGIGQICTLPPLTVKAERACSARS